MTQHDAEQDAAKAAARAHAAIEAVESVAGLRRVAGLFSRVWAVPQAPPMPHDIMRSLVHAGGRVHAAVRDDRLIGAALDGDRWLFTPQDTVDKLSPKSLEIVGSTILETIRILDKMDPLPPK